MTDTIAAISTPPGRGGIGIVRLSGPQAASIAVQLVRLILPPLIVWITPKPDWPMSSIPAAPKPLASTKR